MTNVPRIVAKPSSSAAITDSPRREPHLTETIRFGNGHRPRRHAQSGQQPHRGADRRSISSADSGDVHRRRSSGHLPAHRPPPTGHRPRSAGPPPGRRQCNGSARWSPTPAPTEAISTATMVAITKALHRGHPRLIGDDVPASADRGAEGFADDAAERAGDRVTGHHRVQQRPERAAAPRFRWRIRRYSSLVVGGQAQHLRLPSCAPTDGPRCLDLLHDLSFSLFLVQVS